MFIFMAEGMISSPASLCVGMFIPNLNWNLVANYFWSSTWDLHNGCDDGQSWLFFLTIIFQNNSWLLLMQKNSTFFLFLTSLFKY